MKLYKKTFFSGLALSGALFLAIPLMNMLASHWEIPLNETEKLFNLDLIEGRVNYHLYQAGITGNFEKVVIGKKGWMFLGNQYSQVLNKTRGLKIPLVANQNIEKTIHALKQRQDWLASKGIKTLFAIAPNKHSIYKENLPDWLPAPDRNSTDDFVAKAKGAGIHILDLRVPLLKHKSEEPDLYYKSGTHWNLMGGLIGYQEIVKEMNHRFGMALKHTVVDSRKPMPRSGRELSEFLKITRIMIKNNQREKDFYIKFEGMNDTVCIQDIDRQTLSFKGECVGRINPRLNNPDLPKLVLNDHALNDLTVLWLRDSMGTNISRLFAATFSRSLELHHGTLSIGQLQEFIEKHKPDILFFLIVERNILNPSLQTFFQD